MICLIMEAEEGKLKKADERIPVHELGELIAAVRPLINLQTGYIEAGFDAKTIAENFARVYIHSLEEALTPELAARIKSGARTQQGNFNNREAAISYSMRLAIELLGVVTEFSKNNHT